MNFWIGCLAGASGMYLALLSVSIVQEEMRLRRERERILAARRNCRPRVIRDPDTGNHRTASRRSNP